MFMLHFFHLHSFHLHCLCLLFLCLLFLCLLFFLCLLYSRFIIGRRFSFLKRNRAGRAVRQAVAKTVTEILPYQLCFTIYDIDGSFVTGFCAEPAAITFFFIDMYDFSDHGSFLLAFVSSF